MCNDIIILQFFFFFIKGSLFFFEIGPIYTQNQLKRLLSGTKLSGIFL